jgi:dTDP-4-dehydrorhamnose 3,5-epimerase
VRFEPTPIEGAFLVVPAKIEDPRGFFARTFCQEEFAARGLAPCFVQQSISLNPHRGTLRGMHWQAAPHEEAKLVRCTSGRIWDVILDLRPASATYKQHFGVELAASEHAALYIPEGVAHGFLTLVPYSEVFYQMSVPHHPESARGVRWDDPAFGIGWPEPVQVMSERDATYQDFVE